MNSINLEMLIPMVVGTSFFALIGWIVFVFVDGRRRREQLKVMTDFHTRALDKMGSTADFGNFLETDGGKRFLKSLTIEGLGPRQRIVRSTERGILCLVIGIVDDDPRMELPGFARWLYDHRRHHHGVRRRQSDLVRRLLRALEEVSGCSTRATIADRRRGDLQTSTTMIRDAVTTWARRPPWPAGTGADADSTAAAGIRVEDVSAHMKDGAQAELLSEAEFQDLYRAHGRPLWAYLYRLTGNAADADDLLQEASCRLLATPMATRDDAPAARVPVPHRDQRGDRSLAAWRARHAARRAADERDGQRRRSSRGPSRSSTTWRGRSAS